MNDERPTSGYTIQTALRERAVEGNTIDYWVKGTMTQAADYIDKLLAERPPVEGQPKREPLTMREACQPTPQEEAETIRDFHLRFPGKREENAQAAREPQPTSALIDDYLKSFEAPDWDIIRATWKFGFRAVFNRLLELRREETAILGPHSDSPATANPTPESTAFEKDWAASIAATQSPKQARETWRVEWPDDIRGESWNFASLQSAEYFSQNRFTPRRDGKITHFREVQPAPQPESVSAEAGQWLQLCRQESEDGSAVKSYATEILAALSHPPQGKTGFIERTMLVCMTCGEQEHDCRCTEAERTAQEPQP